jgi:L-asparaginase II
MKPLVNVFRGERLESFHTGSIAVVDAAGRLLALYGDPHEATFLRSSAKPFQALPMLMAGIGEEFDLSPEEIALICASHGGEPHHVATAAALLRRGEFDESDLLCGPQVPYDEKASADLRASDEPPSALHNNCSGKHAGMLLTCDLLDASTADYIAPGHPLQQQIRETVAEFAVVPSESLVTAVDGCGVPSYYLSLYRAALAYARFAAAAYGSGAAGSALASYRDAAREIVDSMTLHPEYVAGAWSMTTPLMQSFDGQLLAKEGAEGFYAMALLPPMARAVAQRLPGADEGPIGIALKVHDGSMARGRNPAILSLLEQLGCDVASKPLLEPFRRPAITNLAGVRVGEVLPGFNLDFL